jgi:hypothetical protein
MMAPMATLPHVRNQTKTGKTRAASATYVLPDSYHFDAAAQKKH